MNSFLTHRYFVKRNLIVTIGLFLCFYFVYHGVQGERSLSRYNILSAKIETMSQEKAAMKKQRAVLEKRVTMLRPSSLDRDLLEERVRFVLGYAAPDEVAVVFSR